MSETDARSPRRRLRDRLIVAIARIATRTFYPSVEVIGSAPTGGPTILAVSHLNGFVDPVVILGDVGRLPRFLAKATLWSNPFARIALNFARVIPVHRAADGSTKGNARMFASAVDALGDHDTVIVFAEGTTHDDPTIRPIRTGVARIALQAAGSGVQDVQVVPVGITYEDKVALRSRLLIRYGEPITIPADAALVTAEGVADHDKAQALTAELQNRIESLTPHFASTEEALALTTAAEITLRRTGAFDQKIPMSKVTADARRLSQAAPARRDTLVALVARYETLRGFVGLDDAEVQRGVDLKTLTRRIVTLGVVIFVLSPVAVAGLFANLVPLALIMIAGLIPQAPVSKGTVRVLVSVIMFPITWLTLAWVDSATGFLGNLARLVTLPLNIVLGPLAGDRTGAWAGLVVFIGVPLMGIVAVVLLGRAWHLAGAVVRWRRFLDRRGQLELVRARRDAVIAATGILLDDAPLNQR